MNQENSHQGLIEMQKCSICKDFVPRFDIRSHTKDHFENFKEHHMCEACGRNFRDSTALHSHMKIHGEKTFQCEFCDRSFFSKQSLNVHESAKHTKKDFKHCDICGESFSTKRVLETHMKNKHGVENRFQCAQCKKYFLTEDGLKLHELKDNCKSNTCTKCDRIFSCGSDMIRHQKTCLNPKSEMENKQFPCHLCGKGFTRLTTLKEHFRKRHEEGGQESEEKKFTCHCGKGFSHEKNLFKHRTTHYENIPSYPPFLHHSTFQ